MDLTKEYEIISKMEIPYDNVGKIEYMFNGCQIRIYVKNSGKHKFVDLVVDTPEATVLRSITFADVKDKEGKLTKRFNFYWENPQLKYVYSYLAKDGHFTDFQDSFKDHIDDYVNLNPLIVLEKNNGIDEIEESNKRASVHSTYGEKIFFKTVKRSHMTDKQYKKTLAILGSDAVNYLKNHHFTSVFTSHVNDAKEFNLSSIKINNDLETK